VLLLGAKIKVRIQKVRKEERKRKERKNQWSGKNEVWRFFFRVTQNNGWSKPDSWSFPSLYLVLCRKRDRIHTQCIGKRVKLNNVIDFSWSSVSFKLVSLDRQTLSPLFFLLEKERNQVYDAIAKTSLRSLWLNGYPLLSVTHKYSCDVMWSGVSSFKPWSEETPDFNPRFLTLLSQDLRLDFFSTPAFKKV
jgi:hypothetical protein